MDIKILEEKNVPLFSRTEIKAHIRFSGATPSTSEVTKALAKKLSADEKTIVMREISTKFGCREANAIAHIYEKEEDMKRIEPTHLFKSEKIKEEKPVEVLTSEKLTEPNSLTLNIIKFLCSYLCDIFYCFFIVIIINIIFNF